MFKFTYLSKLRKFTLKYRANYTSIRLYVSELSFTHSLNTLETKTDKLENWHTVFLVGP